MNVLSQQTPELGPQNSSRIAVVVIKELTLLYRKEGSHIK